jgi:hypothetical protein
MHSEAIVSGLAAERGVARRSDSVHYEHSYATSARLS